MGNTTAGHVNIPQAQTIAGTIVIQRPNKTFVVIASLSTPAANAALYDPSTATFTTQSSPSVPTAANGAGGFAWRRPDGKFLVILGNSTTTTNIYDPDTNVFSLGPTLSGAAAIGASAIQNSDGTVTIVHGGGLTTSTIYDPVRNTMITGPTLTTAANCGFWAVPLQNGMVKTFVGIASGVASATTSMNYDPRSKTFTAGTALSSAHGCGSAVFQRQDGWWISVTGGNAGAAQTTSNIINPIDGTTLAGPTITNGTNAGASVIPRADGTFLILTGNGTTTSTVYIPYGGTWGVGAGIGTAGAGPTLATAVGVGSVPFQRPDGKWVIINGNTTNSVQLADTGWYADGQYLSEQVQVPALSAASVLNWKQNNDNFVRMEVRTASSQAALATAGYSTVGRPGSSIGNAGGETWVQVEVNFRRDFPTFGGALNGVFVSGGGMVYPYRTISQPAIYSYSINNGGDLLTLQDNGLNVFRVTSEGSVYTGQNGGFYSGGADLAENYTSSDSLVAGEVVVADSANTHGVKRSTGQYQKDILGVVSTEPGFVAGAFTENSYPIALVGRVPVKISTENGIVREGDFLTAASIPGYAMRAMVSGRVLGKALENLDLTKTTTCPYEGLGTASTTKCGTVMMFVNLTDYQGGSVEALMAEDVYGQAVGEAVIPGADFPAVDGLADNGIRETKILSFLTTLKAAQAAGSAPIGSDILTNRVSAVNEVISPVIVANILRAKTIQAERIEGLEVYTNKVSKLADAYAGLQASQNQSVKTNTTETIANLTDVQFGKGEFMISLTSLGDIESKGGLVVGGNALFKGKATFTALAEFLQAVTLNGDVAANGRVTFNNDAGGMAVIRTGATRVQVKFAKEYASAPVVSALLTIAPVTNVDGTTEDSQITEARLLAAGYSYFVSNVQPTGFTIVLNKPAAEDLRFNWSATAIKDAKTSESDPVTTSAVQRNQSATTGQ